ncbi:hypothetical protein O6H91_09G049000 [Diphasiastrum complanatum]|uniref:Uncharacterized protein n=1 Tax=Diphasiastrum complanatum TaxID=34168 RepID=A0ACC2CP79_DIPCM|nr:hypothetical protein O6H91_09G049000 [Diphasiastrum complanatum]
MASAAAAVAAKGVVALAPNAVSCPQSLAYHGCHLVQFPRSAGRATRFVLRFVRRQHRPRPFCAAPSAPQAEVEEEEKTLNNGAAESPTVDEVPLTVAEILLQNYAEALGSGDEESLNNAKAQLQAIVDERDSLHQQVATLKVELDTGKDRFLRLNADFENFRRRSLQEKNLLSDAAKADVIESLLPMIDSFERAKGAIKAETAEEERIDNSYQGIYKQFVEIMRGLGVSVVETVGKLFDPEMHEAIMREESGEYAEGIISQEFRRGFKLGAKLLRPAMVKVSSGASASSPPPPSETSVTLESETEGS